MKRFAWSMTLLFFFALGDTDVTMQAQPTPARDSSYVAHDLGQSQRNLALRALMQGKFAEAAEHYERWLKADPRDEESWYNLACVYARTNEQKQALEAWEKAVDAGWDDAAQAAGDDNLAVLRESLRFQAALRRAEETKARRAPANFLRHFLPMQRVGTYLALLPPDYASSDKHYPLCVVLHGSGSTELRHGTLADRFGRDNVIYLLPRAPYTHNAAFKQSGRPGYTAWMQETIDSLDPLYAEVPRFYAGWVMSCVEDVKQKYRVRNDRICIFGHSQGAAFAYVTACLYPKAVRSIHAYAGYFLEDYRRINYLKALKKHSVNVFLGHGSQDRTVKTEESQTMAALMKEVGVQHKLTLYESGHNTSDELISDVRHWIRDVVNASQ